MAGLTEEQWGIVEKGLGKIDGLAERMKKLEELPERMKSLETSILGNGCKGLKEVVYDTVAEVKNIKDNPPKIPAPRFSGKQILASLTIYITIAGLIGTFNFLSLNDIKAVVKDNNAMVKDNGNQVIKVQEELNNHISKGTK